MSGATREREAAERLAEVRGRIEVAARKAGRDPREVTLVGVCKRQPLERVEAAVRAGLSELGENYVQEVAERRPRLEERLSDHPLPRWSLVGGLQRNKARLALSLFECIETVDRASLARALDGRAAQAGRGPEAPYPILVQVNLSREPQKSGVDEEALGDLLEACAGLPALRVEGLMVVPAADPDPEASRPTFARLRDLRDRWSAQPGGRGLRALSMGMSHDFEVAVEEGATRVRVGTALFGPRVDP